MDISWSSRSCRRTHVARPRGEGVTPGTSKSALRDQGPLVTAGPPWEQARAAAILLHGRGGTARGILSLADVVDRPEVAWIAPEANGNAWYPNSFLAPLSVNEPWLSAALGHTVTDVATAPVGRVRARVSSRPERPARVER